MSTLRSCPLDARSYRRVEPRHQPRYQSECDGPSLPLPPPPLAERVAHDQVQVATLEPWQFLREHSHALAPRRLHLADIGAPEHALRTERVEYLAQIRM